MARRRRRKRTPEEKKRMEERQEAVIASENQTIKDISEVKKETANISNPTKKENKKPKTTTVKLVYDKGFKKCTIFSENGEKILEERAERLAMNFASNKVTITTEKGTLETYDIETGEKIFPLFTVEMKLLQEHNAVSI